MHNVIPFALHNIKLSCNRHTPLLIKGRISPGKDGSRPRIWSTCRWIKRFLFLPSLAVCTEPILYKMPVPSPQNSLPQTLHSEQRSVGSEVEWRFGVLAENCYPKTRAIWSWWTERKQAGLSYEGFEPTWGGAENPGSTRIWGDTWDNIPAVETTSWYLFTEQWVAGGESNDRNKTLFSLEEMWGIFPHSKNPGSRSG